MCQLSRSVPAPHWRVPTLLWPFSMPLQRPFAWLCFSLYPSLNLFITSCFVFSIHLCKPPNALIATGFAFLIPFAKRQSKARELHQTFPANPSTLPSPYPILTPPRGGHNSPAQPPYSRMSYRPPNPGRYCRGGRLLGILCR